MQVKYVWIPVIVSILLIPAGFYFVHWSKSGDGAGLYSHDWQPEEVFGYWNPEDFYQPVQSVVGEFKGEQCIACHQGITPGIVKDWQASRHSQVESKVYCN
ncbi:MAG: hydroxylamine oxidoreductase, partial [Aestuariibacter sp.]|nr:hydroxylamine oxidoreductase [Aestuariibacter sp.]